MKRRLLWTVTIPGAALLGMLAVPEARASEAPRATPVNTDSPAKPPTDVREARRRAKRHLKLGVALYQDGNYGGALAEFEASFREAPTAAALQNVALCEMKLFRYVKALQTIEQLQRQFVDELSDRDWSAAQRAKENLKALVGQLTLQVSPSGAHVTINGNTVPTHKLGRPLRLAAGLYTIRATAAAYEPQTREIEVAGGDKLREEFLLVPTTGQVLIEAGGAEATLLVDGHAVGKGSWRGSLRRGTHHVQVVLPGYAPNEIDIDVKPGGHMKVPLPLGPKLDDTTSEVDAEGKQGDTVRTVQVPHGWFAMASASYMMLLEHPDKFRSDSQADTRASAFGLTGGYRLNKHIGLALFLDAGTQRVRGVYAQSTATTYSLTSRRFGAGVQLLFGGERVRIMGAMAVGAVQHDLSLMGNRYTGFNGVLRLEAGPQFNIGHVLLDTTLHATLEGANNALSDDQSAYSEHTVIPQVGIGLRIGYSQWAGP